MTNISEALSYSHLVKNSEVINTRFSKFCNIHSIPCIRYDTGRDCYCSFSEVEAANQSKHNPIVIGSINWLVRRIRVCNHATTDSFPVSLIFWLTVCSGKGYQGCLGSSLGSVKCVMTAPLNHNSSLLCFYLLTPSTEIITLGSHMFQEA